MVSDACGENKWLLTCFYGHPEASQRRRSWDLLKSFKNVFSSWCVIGDFNEILSNDEKVGGSVRSENQMELFRQVLEQGRLHDLGWRGEKYTWNNRHEDATYIKERLDIVLATQNWIDGNSQ